MSDKMLKLADRIRDGLAVDCDAAFAPPLYREEWSMIERSLRAAAEPFRWMIEYGGTELLTASATTVKMYEGPNVRITPLYTHPVPGTAEQCAQLAESHVGAGRSPDYDEACRDIARAIRDTAPGAQADAEIVAALEVAAKQLADIREFCTDHRKRPCGDPDAECPISMGEWFSSEDLAELDSINAALAKAKGGSAPVTEVDIDSLTGTADDQGNFANE